MGASVNANKEKTMAEMKMDRVTVSERMRLNYPVEEVWPQLCPTREYDWIETWKCDLVHSESGYNELGCVFRTDFPTEGGEEVWMTCRFDPMKRIEFVRTNDMRVIHFIIDLEADGDGTKLTWTQHVAALNEAGNTYVAEKPGIYVVQMKMVDKMLSHYLETGEMLRGDSLGLIERIGKHVHGRKAG
jgi:hypothetical protein